MDCGGDEGIVCLVKGGFIFVIVDGISGWKRIRCP